MEKVDGCAFHWKLPSILVVLFVHLLSESGVEASGKRNISANSQIQQVAHESTVKKAEVPEIKATRGLHKQSLKRKLSFLNEEVTVNRDIVSYDGNNPDDVEEIKRTYLAQPEIRSIRYEEILSYFDKVFPLVKRNEKWTRRPHRDHHPYFLNPDLLVDFTVDNADGIPIKIGQTKEEAIKQSRHAIENILGFADEGNLESKGWVLNLRFYLKRVLKELKDNPSPQNVKLAIVVLTSVGRHCGPGGEEGAELIHRIFFKGKNVGFKEPQTMEEHIFQALDQLRDKVFRLTVAFAGDTQTAHTTNYYRQKVYRELAIPPGFSNDPHELAAWVRNPVHEVIERFFKGKKGHIHSQNAEERRSHIGYTPATVAGEIINLIKIHSEWIPALKSYFSDSVDKKTVLNWAVKHQREVLEPLLIYDKDEKENIKTIHTIAPGDLKQLYVEHTYFAREENKWTLNGLGAKELLIDLGVFLPQ